MFGSRVSAVDEHVMRGQLTCASRCKGFAKRGGNNSGREVNGPALCSCLPFLLRWQHFARRQPFNVEEL